MEPRCMSENFHGAGRLQPFGQNVFQRHSSNTAKCLLSGKCTFNCTSKSKRATPWLPRLYRDSQPTFFFFSRALSPHPPFFCHLYPSPSHTSSSSFPSSVFFSPLSSLSLFPPLPFPSLFHAFLSQVFISTLLSLPPPPLAPLPFPPFYFSLFNKNSHVCAFEVRSQSATRAHPLLVSHPLPLVAFLVVEPPFPRFRSFQKYHRHTSPSPPPPPPLRQEFQRANFAIRNLRHRPPDSTSNFVFHFRVEGRRKKFGFSPPLLVDYSAVSKHRFGLFIERSRRFFRTN